MVEAELPFAVTEAGAAPGRCPLREPTEKVTEAVCVTVTPSVVSVAVYETVSAVVSETAKVASPAASVVAERVTATEPLPLAARPSWPEPGYRSRRAASRSRSKLEPSAATVVEAESEDWAAVTVPATNVTVAVWVTVGESVVSFAV